MGVDLKVSEHARAAPRRRRGLRRGAVRPTSPDHLDFHVGMDVTSLRGRLSPRNRHRQGWVCIDDDWGRRLVRAPASRSPRSAGRRPTRTGGSGSTWSTRRRSAVTDPGSTSTSGRAFPAASTSPARRWRRPRWCCSARMPGPWRGSGPPTRTCRAGWRRSRAPRGQRAPRRRRLRPHPGGDPRPAASPAPDHPRQLLRRRDRAGGDRDGERNPPDGARRPPRWPTWSSSPTTTRVLRTRPPSAPPLKGVAAARGGGREPAVLEVGDRRAAIAAAVEAGRDQGRPATVAVVGKGHESGQEVGGVVHPFDDRRQVAQALRRARGDDPRWMTLPLAEVVEVTGG